MERSVALAYAPLGWMAGSIYFKMPEHFGYPENGTVGDFIGQTTYIVIAERFRKASADPTLQEWMNIPDSLAKPGFNEKDFQRLCSDRTVSQVYANREFEVLVALPKAGT